VPRIASVRKKWKTTLIMLTITFHQMVDLLRRLLSEKSGRVSADTDGMHEPQPSPALKVEPRPMKSGIGIGTGPQTAGPP